MADDHRYSWLDDKAAERLLRGEPVEGQYGAPGSRNDRPHAEAERLAAVLSAVAEAARPDGPAHGSGPLPGEEAAVAAFRAAQARPAGVAMSAEAQVGDKSTRIAQSVGDTPAATPAAAGRRTGWLGLRRPLRAGMVAAVAGCALSGFAVAAAAGVLPFGDSGGTPGPRASVTDTGPGNGESARPEISEGGGTPTAPDDAGGTSEGAQGRGVPGGGEGHGKHGRDERGKGKKGPHGSWKTGNGRSNGNGQRALGVCRRYLASEAGTGPGVGQKALKKLQRAAGSRSGVHDYCVQLVGDDTAPRGGTGGTGKTSGNGGTNGNGDTSGNGDDSGSGDDGGGASNPAPPPPPSSDTSSGEGSGTPSPDPTPSGTPSKDLGGTPSASPSGTSSGSPSTTPSGSVTPGKSSAS